jgi:CMP-N-acetylneuraminic acid synthetase
MKVLSIVCARAGSKGLNNKCISKINNKMVVEYSIEYSLSLGDDVDTVVSTDIGELIVYCRQNDIDYIERSPDFCTDDCKIDDTLAEAIETREANYPLCSLVYGNIPTRYSGIFFEALGFLNANKDFDAAISMQNAEKYHPAWMFDFNDEVLPKEKETHYKRQMLPQKMIHDGHTLIFKSKKFINKYKGLISYDTEYKYSVYGDRIKPIINDKVIIDIDTKKELELAEAVITNYKKRVG